MVRSRYEHALSGIRIVPHARVAGWWVGREGREGRVAREWRNLKFCGIKNRSKKKKYIEVVLAPEHGEFIYSQIVEISFGRTFVCFDQRTVRNFIRSRVRTRACVCVYGRRTLEWEGEDREREREKQRRRRRGRRKEKNWSRPNGVKIFTKFWPVWRATVDSTSVMIKRWNGS